MRFACVSGLVLVLASSSAAMASSWIVKGEEDLFSSTGKATLLSFIDASTGIHAQCENKKVKLSFIFRQNWDPAYENVSVDFVYRVDNSANVIRRANFYQHNDKFTGVAIYYAYDAVVALDAFSRAKKSILVGFDFGKGRASESASIRGSTAAIKRFWDACHIDAQAEIKTLGRPSSGPYGAPGAPPGWFPPDEPPSSGIKQ